MRSAVRHTASFRFTILGVKAGDGFLELTSVPFTSELKMYSPA